EELGLRGRIIIGDEGINGTVSGAVASTDAYREALLGDPLTSAIQFKIDLAEDHVFPKLSIKYRPEIVTLGLNQEDDIDPNEITGDHLDPAEFLEAMQDENALVIDGRNLYESELGRFKGAICPEIDNFRDFPAWLREHRRELEGRRLLTYCTGGIRCEKLSGFLKQEGFEDVAQLDGGIIRYSQDPATQGRDFEGLCYVFDERVGIEVNHTETRKVITHCRHCDVEWPHYGNCQWNRCNAQIFVCESCRESHGLYCDEYCREQHAEQIAAEDAAMIE
ncbi:MAG: rhodanese-related sulfurtransferase, partial [Verrucomicrobiota bacterium]